MVDDVPYAYSLATLDWSREEHAVLGDRRRIDGERLRARLLSRSLARIWRFSLAQATATLRRSR